MIRRIEWRVCFTFLVPVVYFLRILIWGNTPNLSEFIGALIGVGLSVLLLRRSVLPAIATGALGMAILAGGLLPTETRVAPYPFSWIPFVELFGSYPLYAFSEILKLSFLYGAYVWFALRISRATNALLLAGFIAIALMEIWQRTHFPGRPGVTEPVVFALMAGLILWNEKRKHTDWR